MFIWVGEVEENWNYMEENEFDNIEGEKYVAAETFDEAKEKLLSLFSSDEKSENEDYDPNSEDDFDRKHKFFIRKKVQIISLYRENELDA